MNTEQCYFTFQINLTLIHAINFNFRFITNTTLFGWKFIVTNLCTGFGNMLNFAEEKHNEDNHDLFTSIIIIKFARVNE